MTAMTRDDGDVGDLKRTGLLRGCRTPIRWLRGCSAQLLHQMRDLIDEQIRPVLFDVVTAVVSNDSTATRRQVLETFLQRVPYFGGFSLLRFRNPGRAQ